MSSYAGRTFLEVFKDVKNSTDFFLSKVILGNIDMFVDNIQDMMIIADSWEDTQERW